MSWSDRLVMCAVLLMQMKSTCDMSLRPISVLMMAQNEVKLVVWTDIKPVDGIQF